MTKTDIPPGGEGEIEVTFSSGRKKGKQKKTITVESNDPVNQKTTLHISALIEFNFGFEAYNLNFGRIHKGDSITKTAVLVIKDPSKRNLLELSAQSSHVNARVIPSSSDDESRINIEVTMNPDTPPGPINESITAKLLDDSYPAANLRIRGTVVGNVGITPENIRFSVDTSRTAAEQDIKTLKVISTSDHGKLRLLSVADPQDLLAFEVDTLVADRQYEIQVSLRESVMELSRYTVGDIRITTDDEEQPEVGVRYTLVFPRR